MKNIDKKPEEAFKAFIEDMLGEALKVFLAYWAYAYDQGAVPLLGHMTDIMNLTKNSKRETSFSVEEKRRFWELSSLLEETYLTISFKIKIEEITIKHPFLTISTTACETTKNLKSLKECAAPNLITQRGYPDRVGYSVLDPDKFKEKANLATEVSKGTIKLHKQDILLALSCQIRATQLRKKDFSMFDRNFMIARGNLEETDEANPRQADKRLEEKLGRLKDAQTIGEFSEKEGKYLIRKPNKKTQKTEPKT